MKTKNFVGFTSLDPMNEEYYKNPQTMKILPYTSPKLKKWLEKLEADVIKNPSKYPTMTDADWGIKPRYSTTLPIWLTALLLVLAGMGIGFLLVFGGLI